MTTRHFAVHFLLLLALAGSGCAAPFRGVDVLPLDPPAQPVANLRPLDGAQTDLPSVVRSHQATVLIWWATRCPCVRRYEERILALRSAFSEQSVALLAVSSNADDDPQRLRAVSRERGFSLPIVVDPAGGLATMLGVRATPTAVVLDRSGRIRFRGWIDNERTTGQRGRVAYVELAVNALLGTGANDAPRSSPVFGCRITRSISEPQQCVPAPAAAPACEHSGS